MINDLLLKGEDVSNAAVHRISDSGLGFVGNGDDGLAAVGGRHVQQQLRHVAGAEHLVYGGEPRGALLRAEIGGEHALRRALPPEELACAARRSAAARH